MMFSNTTIESSTRIPMISVIASSETVSIVKPKIFMTKKVTKSDIGIAIITTIALRHDLRKTSIAMPVKTMPSIKVCSTPHNCALVSSACTLRILNAMSGYFASIAGRAASTL